MKQIVLAGVGGQGILLASRILARAAIDQGFDVKTAETIGMAQRGGSVVSHLRIADGGEQLFSPLISKGDADLILGFEPGEALRACELLSPQGTILAADIGVLPTMTSMQEVHYDVEAILNELDRMQVQGQIASFVRVPASYLCQQLGSRKVLNTIMLGAALSAGVLPFDLPQIIRSMEQSVKPKFVQLNTDALEAAARITL